MEKDLSSLEIFYCSPLRWLHKAFFLGSGGDRVSLHIPGWPRDHSSPPACVPRAVITGVGHHAQCCGCFVLFSWDRVFLCCPGWSQIHRLMWSFHLSLSGSWDSRWLRRAGTRIIGAWPRTASGPRLDLSPDRGRGDPSERSRGLRLSLPSSFLTCHRKEIQDTAVRGIEKFY